jgi:hypothetical protein
MKRTSKNKTDYLQQDQINRASAAKVEDQQADAACADSAAATSGPQRGRPAADVTGA